MEQTSIDYILGRIDEARNQNAKAADHMEAGRYDLANFALYQAELQLTQLQHSMLRWALMDQREDRDGITARP